MGLAGFGSSMGGFGTTTVLRCPRALFMYGGRQGWLLVFGVDDGLWFSGGCALLDLGPPRATEAVRGFDRARFLAATGLR